MPHIQRRVVHSPTRSLSRALAQELDDACMHNLHTSLLAEHLNSVPSPPPPPPAADVFTNEPARCGGLPYITATRPQNITLNTNGTFGAGSYEGQTYLRGSPLQKGAWTLLLVVQSDSFGQLNSLDFLTHPRTSIGTGARSVCAVSDSATGCGSGHVELDRSGCSKAALFGSDWNLCTGGRGCPFVVVEMLNGPRASDVICRVARLDHNDRRHHCAHDPSLFCHVISVRAGPVNGTLLRVDNGAPDVNVAHAPVEQAMLFGGGQHAIMSSSHVHEFVAYDYELEDDCLTRLHEELIRTHLQGELLVPSPPAPPSPPPGVYDLDCAVTPDESRCCGDGCAYSRDGTCDDGGSGSEFSLCALGTDCTDCDSRCGLSRVPALPYIHSALPDITFNGGGVFAGTTYDSVRGAFYRGGWTVSFVFYGTHINQWGARHLIRDADQSAWTNTASSIGVGSQVFCGATQSGSSCAGGNSELDRGSCTSETLYTSEHAYACTPSSTTPSPAPPPGIMSAESSTQGGCPFITRICELAQTLEIACLC
jgi:hypothetical protein